MSPSLCVSYVRIAIALVLFLCASTANSVVVFNDDFESGLGNWSISSGAGSAVINTQTANSPSRSLRLGERAVALDSAVIDTSGSVGVEVSAWIRRGSDSFSEDPDSGEDLSIQYRDASNNWITLETFSGSGTQGEIFDRQYTLGSDSVHAGFRLRLRVADGDGSPFDYWHVDDVVVDTISSATLPTSARAEWRFDEEALSGAADEVRDSSGNNYHGLSNNVTPTTGLLCNAADMSATGISDFISVNGNALDGLSDFTIVAWVQTTQSSTFAMLSAANGNSDLEANEAVFLFDNGNEFWPAITSSNFNSNTKLPATSALNNGSWHQVAWTRNASTAQSCLFVDGVLEGCVTHTDGNDNSPLDVAVNGLILGQEQDDLAGGYDATQALEGLLDEMIVFDSRLNSAQLTTIKNNIESGSNWDGSARSCSLTVASDLEFRMDEASWSGVADEVVDSSGNNDHASARGGLTTVDSGHLCRAGDFDGVDDYIESNDIYDSLKGTSSMSFWIKTTQTGDNTGWRAPGIAGIEQSGGSDDIFWGWLDASGRIGLSVANDFTTKSTIAINDDVYHHIVLTRDATSGAYKIYIDGNLNKSGTLTTGIIGNSFSSLGRIEDTGGTPEYFEGVLDEVKVFGRVLDDADVTDLFNETRDCPIISGCAASFPDGISSHNNGTVDFGSIAQLFSSPDGVLDAATVNRNGGNLGVRTCDTVDCTASGAAVPELDPGSFPSFTSSQGLNVGWGETKVLGDVGDTDTYNNVSVSGNGVLNVSSTYTEYYINNLSLMFGSVLNLAPGDYWVNSLSISSSATITVVGTGTARLFVNNTLSVGSATLINSPSLTNEGSPEKLFIFGYGNVTLNSTSTTSAIVYAQGDMTLRSESYLYGAATADDITLDFDSQVTYDADAVSLIDLGSICGGGSGGCSLGSFLVSQPEYGLACPNARAVVNIKALCAGSTTTKDDYSGVINLTSDESTQSEFYLATSGGAPVNSVTLDSSHNGEVDVYLFHKNENHDLKVTAEDTTLAVSSTAIDGTDFRTSGFEVDRASDFDFACGATQSLTVTATGQDTAGGAACNTLTGFNGTKTLKAWADVNIDPATPGIKNTGLPERILLNGQSVAETKPATHNVTADFNAGVATLSVGYMDVGEVIDVSFVHDEAPYDGSVPEISDPSDPGLKGSTGSFVVYPKEVQVSTTSSCSGTLKDCPLFAKADEEFAVTGKAVCDNGTDVAKSYIGTVSLTHAVSAPLSGSNGTLTNNTLTFAKNDKGVVTESNKKISEVGVFKITSEPEDYFGKDVISLFVSTNIGRFYPDRFDVSAINNGSFSKSCDSYSYVGQPFGYSDAPSMLLTAKSVDGAVTENYTHSDFMKLIATDVERGFPLSDNLTNGADGVTLMAVSTVPVTGSLSVTANAGVMSYRFDSNDKYTYTQNSNATIAPFISDLSITTTKIEDKEGVKASSLPIFKPVGADIRYGRWVMENVFGPENMSLSMPGYLQYLTSTGYALNTDDKCSAILTADISSGPSGNSSPGEIKDITVKSGSTDFSYDQNLDGGPSTGEGSFSFTAPGAGNDGTVEISLDLSSQSWLRHDWDGDGAVEDHPPVTATFGRYRGHDRIIYWREVNN
ncbi:LamG domain-containing protein [Alkalimarinus coralli]|uniref:LamG domain-containing protein n=1 Tax=Alkalimarinus coralli TaxID=2935863 RepID=UPI00202AD19B|nr:LamG domain-containing protein [Alkalimarinus coralli]